MAALFHNQSFGQGCALAPRSYGSPLTEGLIMKQSTAGEATIVVRYLKFNVLHFISETAQATV
jgi:hypothetical protein